MKSHVTRCSIVSDVDHVLVSRVCAQEFLVNGHSWDATLPLSIDAFITSTNGASEKAHAAFLRQYRLRHEDVPLLTITPSIRTPFVDGRRGFGSEGDPTRNPTDKWLG